MPVVCIIGADFQVHNMFLERGWEITSSLFEADLLQFTGGADVSPFLYHEKSHPKTSYSSVRDEREEILYKQFPYKPKTGICRGGQFLHVMNKGRMYQDVDGHAIAGTHTLTLLPTLEEINVTSTHHQMMRFSPEMSDYEIIGIAKEASFREYMKEEKVVRNGFSLLDLEILFYLATNSLCFQPHPEYGVQECEDLYFGLLSQYFGLV